MNRGLIEAGRHTRIHFAKGISKIFTGLLKITHLIVQPRGTKRLFFLDALYLKKIQLLPELYGLTSRFIKAGKSSVLVCITQKIVLFCPP